MRYTIIAIVLALLPLSSSSMAQCLSRISNQDDLEEISFGQLSEVNGIISTNIDFEEYPTEILGPELHPSNYLTMKALPGIYNMDYGDNYAVICPGGGSKCLTAYPFYEQPEGLPGDNYPESPAFIISEGPPLPGNHKASFAGTIELEFLNPVFAVSMLLGQWAVVMPIKVEFFNISGELLDTQFVDESCGYLAMKADPEGDEPCWINKIVISPDLEEAPRAACYTLDEVFFIHFDNAPVANDETSWGSLKSMYR